jgi:hypothetical protein
MKNHIIYFSSAIKYLQKIVKIDHGEQSLEQPLMQQDPLLFKFFNYSA